MVVCASPASVPPEGEALSQDEVLMTLHGSDCRSVGQEQLCEVTLNAPPSGPERKIRWSAKQPVAG